MTSLRWTLCLQTSQTKKSMCRLQYPWTSYRAYTSLKKDKEMSSTEYLGCNIETFKNHIEQQLTERMSCENYGEWHIDHKIPLKYNNPSLEEVTQRLHCTNTQPMWARENMSKGCRYISG